MVLGKHCLQGIRLAREFAAHLDAGIARLAGFGETGLQRSVAAQGRQVVIGPSDWVDADFDAHDLSSGLRPAEKLERSNAHRASPLSYARRLK